MDSNPNINQSDLLIDPTLSPEMDPALDPALDPTLDPTVDPSSMSMTGEGESLIDPTAEPTEQSQDSKIGIGDETLTSSVTHDVLSAVKTFSEEAVIPTRELPIVAGFPFTVSIAGALTDWEKAKLLDVVTREDMGLREVDLEPMLEAGRVLIPRVSEFAAVLIVQALRGTSAMIEMFPSDEKEGVFEFSTESTPSIVSVSGETKFEVDHMLVIEGEKLPSSTNGEVQDFEVLDVMIASAVIKSHAIEAEKSTEFQDLVETLKRQLRYRALRKGATAVLKFHFEALPMSIHASYRVTASGTAVRVKDVKSH